MYNTNLAAYCSKPFADMPTFYFELIQKKDSFPHLIIITLYFINIRRLVYTLPKTFALVLLKS